MEAAQKLAMKLVRGLKNTEESGENPVTVPLSSQRSKPGLLRNQR
jgi:hypothetical protein